MGNGFIEVWDKMDKDERNQLIRSAQDLTGSNLRVRLQIFIEQESESMQSISHSPDLADKYKHKPAQLSRPNRNSRLRRPVAENER